MIFDNLYWREPLFFLVFLLPWFIILLAYYRQKKIWSRIADPHLLPWLYARSYSAQQIIRQTMLLIAWLLFSLALAGPRTPQWIPPSLQENDVSIMTIIDFSRSMKARDWKNEGVSTDRIKMAQKLLNQWFDEGLEKSTDSVVSARMHIGLNIYSAHSHTLLPPTNDRALLKHYNSQLHKFRPPTLGNNLAASLKSAQKLLQNLAGKHYIIVLSDGDLDKKSSREAQIIAAQIKQDGIISLSIIGMGKDEAVSIPITTGKASVINGKTIVSRRNIAWLKQFAEQSGGIYHNAESIKQLKLDQLLNLPKPHIDSQSSHKVIWNEWFFIPLLGGMFFSLLALQISGHRAFRLISISLVLLLSACDQSNNLMLTHDEFNKKIKQALLAEDYVEILSLVKINGDSLQADGSTRFAKGIACYRLKDYVCAQQVFSSLAWSGSGNFMLDKSLKAKAIFNLANTHFRLGDYAQASVLFKDAQRQGISSSKTQINQQFSDSLAAAVQRRLADIAKTKQRADWLSAVQKLPEGFEDKLADGIYLSQKNNSKKVLFSLSEEEQNRLIQQGIEHIQTMSKKQLLDAKDFWVLSEHKNLPQQTADLFNHLMAFEVGLHYVPDQALQVEGQRPW